MNESSFAMHVVEEAPALRVALSGRLDTITAPEFQAQVLPLVEGASSCIIYSVILCVAACSFTTLATVMSTLVKQRKA